MDAKKYISFTTDDFVLDLEFAAWVVHLTVDTDKLWTEFLRNHPDKRAEISEATFIVKALQTVEEKVSEERLDVLLRNIQSGFRAKRRRILITVARIAAVAVVLIGSLSIILIKDHVIRQFPETLQTSAIGDKGKIVLPDGSAVEFDTKETVIDQTLAGNLLVNHDTIKTASAERVQDPAALNQIIIPYGKRSEVTLADGTRVWLNSGSQLSYPSAFSKNSREVFLSGEAFFEVTDDPDRPFLVITQDVRISVLGTRFNVTSYTEDKTSQTVLLNGSVSIKRNSLLARSEKLIPGERMVFNRDTESMTKDLVDTQYITSWVYGYLIFENEPTPEIFKKLERYYNQTILLDAELNDITFSGKLDLKENLRDVLESIDFASSVKITVEGGQYIVKRD